MSDGQHQNNDLRTDSCFTPSLESSARTWYEARRLYESQPDRGHQNAYCKATDELGQAFSKWRVERPELFEQLRLWQLP